MILLIQDGIVLARLTPYYSPYKDNLWKSFVIGHGRYVSTLDSIISGLKHWFPDGEFVFVS